MDTSDIIVWIVGLIVSIAVVAGFTETETDKEKVVDVIGRSVGMAVVGGAFIALLFFVR